MKQIILFYLLSLILGKTHTKHMTKRGIHSFLNDIKYSKLQEVPLNTEVFRTIQDQIVEKKKIKKSTQFSSFSHYYRWSHKIPILRVFQHSYGRYYSYYGP